MWWLKIAFDAIFFSLQHHLGISLTRFPCFSLLLGLPCSRHNIAFCLGWVSSYDILLDKISLMVWCCTFLWLIEDSVLFPFSFSIFISSLFKLLFVDYSFFKNFRSAIQQKKAEEEKQYGAIDYDAPIEPKSGTLGLGTKVNHSLSWCIFVPL